MKHLGAAVLLFGLLSFQSLRAQMFLFEATQYAASIDSTGQHVFKPCDLSLFIHLEKDLLYYIERATYSVRDQEGIRSMAREKSQTDKTVYSAQLGTEKFKLMELSDYKDEAKQDDFVVTENGEETTHFKGVFRVIYLTKQER